MSASKKLIVSKFGGTSMGTRDAMLNAARIVLSKPEIRVVVVSATSGTTNQLLKLRDLKRSGNTSALKEELSALKSRHLELAQSLDCDANQMASLQVLFQELETRISTLEEISDRDLEAVLSIGERLASIIFVQALRSEKKVDVVLIDAREYLKTDSRFGKAEPDTLQSLTRCESLRTRLADAREILVTQGFIGSDLSGNTTTLGRGGSDYSAALFAESLKADELEIWTDVPGILTMDPRVVSSARIIPEISFSEAAEMANFGAKVLHPATLWPAVRAGIPVFVGSTFQPEKNGTRILPTRPKASPLIRAIAVRNKQTLITVSSLRMLNTHGFLAKMFEVLARHHLSIDLVTTSEVSVALTVDETSMGSSGKSVREHTEMLDELRTFADVKIEEDLSLIAIIGNSLNHASGVAAKVFQSISEFNVRLVCHGASEHNICFLVSSKDANEVAKRLHHVCIEWSSL
jgi:aspartate kinase